jgi:lambda repressor-like predicted transcriptional regulator
VKTRLRLKNKAAVTPPPVADVPILIPDKALEAIKGNEAEPYELVEAIPFPSEGAGGIYTGAYFDSLLKLMKERPLGGSKTGHENEKDDFFTIGGKIDRTSENEGVCYLRIMVPAEGYETTNSGFIRSCKTGNQEFSIVADVEGVRGNDGKMYFTEELGRPRNDAVPEGAMPQTVSNSTTEKELMDLISRGEIDIDGDTKELTANGKVCRKAALHMQFNGPDKALGARLMNAIAKKLNHKEKNQVPKEELMEAIKAAIANSTLTLEEISQAVGLENKLRNATDEQRAALVKAIAEALELPPETPAEELLKAAKAAFDEAEEAAESVVEAEAANIANGKKIKNADGTEADNPAYIYAKDKLKGQRGQKLKNSIESLKKDTVMLSLRSKQADTRVAGGGAKTDGDDSGVDLEV